MASPFALTPEQMAEAAVLYEEEKWSATQIASFYGVDKSTIQLALRRLGVASRDRYVSRSLAKRNSYRPEMARSRPRPRETESLANVLTAWRHQ